MSAVKWCDLGQHPFPADQPGATTMTFGRNVGNQWGGSQPSNIAADVCAACAIDSGMPTFTDVQQDAEARDRQMEVARNIRDGKPTTMFKRAKAITNGESKEEKIEKYKARQADPDYIKFLELMDDNGLTIEEVAERLTRDQDDR